MIVEQSREIIEEVNKAFIGKNNIIEKVLMTIYAGGHVLLEQGKELTRDEIRKKMSGNLCRCTGYQNIVNAVDKVMHENAESSRKE